MRPSKLVEKIIEKIRAQERSKRSQGIASLANSVWAITQKIGRNNRSVVPVKPAFATVVDQALQRKLNPGPEGALRGARAFRAAAQSVLSPANRQFMAEQARRADQLAHKKKLVIAGKTFSIDEDDLSVVDEEGTAYLIELPISKIFC